MIRSNVATNDRTGIASVVDNGTTITVEGHIITIKSHTGSQVRLYDAVGRELNSIISTGHDELEVPASGVYLVKIGNYPARRIVVLK